jgi:hypothetical protein
VLADPLTNAVFLIFPTIALVWQCVISTEKGLEKEIFMEQQVFECGLTADGPLRTPPRKGQKSVSVNLAESPVSWLYARGHLSHREFAAGERLRMDWEIAQLNPSITMRWEEVSGRGSHHDGQLNPTERQIAAKARFDGALAQAGKGLSDILWRVACAGEALVDAEKALAWPSRSGKLVLKLALDRVADFYRIA